MRCIIPPHWLHAGPIVEAAPANGAANGAAKPEASASAPAKPAAEAMTVDPPAVPAAKLSGLELGPVCNQCGGMMQRTGSCYTCSSCGNNTGCG